MKNSILLSSVAFLFYAATALGQGGNTGHFSVTGEFLGWDGTGTVQSLNIRNNFNQPINFFTGNTQRMTILGADNLLGSPQFATERAGNVGIGTRHPLTLLHMGGEGASGAGWRDWMDIGTYYASREGFDNMYVGLRRIAADRNEAIINFGNNPSSNGGNGDQLRFVFSAAPGNGIASSNDGFEIARMWVDGLDNGRMGIGDFFTAGTQPENTLEIMASEGSPYWNLPGGASGLRFTHLTSDSTTTTNPGKGILAVDENGDVIYVDPLAGGGSGLDCRWIDQPSQTIGSEDDMVTAIDPTDNCYRGKIGIGTDALKVAKLNVLNTFSRDQVLIGIHGESRVLADGMNTYVIGVAGDGNTGSPNIPSSGISVGVQGRGKDSRYTIGVNGLAEGNLNGTITGISIGVRGIARGASTRNIGVYGEVLPPLGSINSPGYFVG